MFQCKRSFFAATSIAQLFFPVKFDLAARSSLKQHIFDDRPYIAKMTADATTEKQYLYQTYIKQDLDKFDAALKLYVDRGPSLHCKTIVAEHLSVFFADMLDMIIDNQYAIKKCKLCGKYFVPIESNNIDYCLRPFKDKKTCRDIGPGIKAQEKIKNDDVRAELKRTYNRLRTRKERHPERPEFAQQFEQFNQEKRILSAPIKPESYLTSKCYLHWKNGKRSDTIRYGNHPKARNKLQNHSFQRLRPVRQADPSHDDMDPA